MKILLAKFQNASLFGAPGRDAFIDPIPVNYFFAITQGQSKHLFTTNWLTLGMLKTQVLCEKKVPNFHLDYKNCLLSGG